MQTARTCSLRLALAVRITPNHKIFPVQGVISVNLAFWRNYVTNMPTIIIRNVCSILFLPVYFSLSISYIATVFSFHKLQEKKYKVFNK